jgi:transcriptional regulator with XRE-family HTH domain
MGIQQTFGASVRFHRQAKSWSQDDLSEASGLHRTYISGIERGVRNPTIEIVHVIALALDINVSTLFENTDVSQKASRTKLKSTGFKGE